MKIKQKANPHKFTFSSLACGDTFRSAQSNPDVIWMKTSRIEVEEHGLYNAVNLSNGNMETFYKDEEVVPVTITAVEE